LDFTNTWGDYFFFAFWGSLAYTPKRIFTQNTSEDDVPGNEVPFGNHHNDI